MPRMLAVFSVVAVSVVGVGSLSYVVFGQLYDLADRLPTYEGNITAKVKALQSGREGVISKVATALDHVRTAMKIKPVKEEQLVVETPSSDGKVGKTDAPLPGEAKSTVPMPVEVVDPVSEVGIITQLVEPLLTPIASALIVIVFVIFMLLERGSPQSPDSPDRAAAAQLHHASARRRGQSRQSLPANAVDHQRDLRPDCGYRALVAGSA